MSHGKAHLGVTFRVHHGAWQDEPDLVGKGTKQYNLLLTVSDGMEHYDAFLPKVHTLDARTVCSGPVPGSVGPVLGTWVGVGPGPDHWAFPPRIPLTSAMLWAGGSAGLGGVP